MANKHKLYENESVSYEVLLRSGLYALLETERNYIVAHGFNEKDQVGQMWGHGSYYDKGSNNVTQAIALSKAVDYYTCLVKETYITRERMIELATRFKDVAEGGELMCDVLEDMTDFEKAYFGIDSEFDSDDDICIE